MNAEKMLGPEWMQKGFQMQIHDAKWAGMLQGEIENVFVENGVVKVRFMWMARTENFNRWPKDIKWITYIIEEVHFNLKLLDEARRHCGSEQGSLSYSFSDPDTGLEFVVLVSQGQWIKNPNEKNS